MKSSRKALLPILVAALQTQTLFAGDGAAQTHPFAIHDMLAMDRISDPRVSPNGKRIVFVRRTTDLEANRGRTDLGLIDVEGQNLRRLTSHPAGERNPRWSPDGKTIYFLTARSQRSQIWKIAVDGGETEQVTRLPLGVTGFNLSPDGRRVALSLDVFPDAPTLRKTVKRLDEAKKRKSSGRVYDSMFVRHWDTWKDGRRSHLFVMPLEGGEPIDGGGISNLSSNPILTRCRFVGNVASTLAFGNAGGAIDNSNSNVVIDHCSFIMNEADVGGAMNSISGPDSSVFVGNSEFFQNTAHERGLHCATPVTLLSQSSTARLSETWQKTLAGV